MLCTSVTERIRRLIDQTFVQLGAAASAEPCETILIHDGHYCGRRFSRGDLEAVWFAEENEIKFYGPGGKLVRVIASGEITAGTNQRVA